MEPLTALQRALADLIAERDQLDQDIEALQRIIARRVPANAKSESAEVTARRASGDKNGASPPLRPGEAREAILGIMADGKIWTPGEIATIRGTTPQAALRSFTRMMKEPDPPIQRIGKSHRYRLASKGDAQGSLPVVTGGEEHISQRPEVGGS
jgi:hypothetical protein